MTRPASRIGDMSLTESDTHGQPCCPHIVEGPAVTGSADILFNGRGALRLLDTGSHAATCCGNNVWKAVEGAATVLVNGRPVVRMNDLTEHCGGFGQMLQGSANVFIGGPSVFDSRISTEELASYIVGEMTANVRGGDVAYMRGKNDVSFREKAVPFLVSGLPLPGAPLLGAALSPVADRAQAYGRFFKLVRPGGDWDHKEEIRTRYGQWAHDVGRGASYRFDVWSNIHYGYVGAASGFSNFELTSGGGAAQILAGTSDVALWDREYWRRRTEDLGDADFLAAFDDPRDQAAVMLGIELWNEYGEDITPEELLNEVRDAEGLAVQKHFKIIRRHPKG